MFICSLGKHTSAVREKLVRVVVETRERVYSADEKSAVRGYEIVREVPACSVCAAKHSAALAKVTA